MQIKRLFKHLSNNHRSAGHLLGQSVTFVIGIAASVALDGQQPLQLNIQWDKPVVVSRSTPTLQVVVNPPLRPGQPLNAASYKAVKELGADYVRYVPWLPYPRLAVAELEPPTSGKTSWDFSLIDPMTIDFLNATEGHPTVMNFSTMPAWIFKTDKPVTYPADPDQPVWNYTQGAELRDPTGKEMADYYERLVNWYVNGGFTDENGVRHESGYHYKFPVWEVLNEVDSEHSMTPENYTKRYDAIVEAIIASAPKQSSWAWLFRRRTTIRSFSNTFSIQPITSRGFRSTTSRTISTHLLRPRRPLPTGNTPSLTRRTAS